MKKSSLIIFVSLIILVGLFIILRPQGVVKLPINNSDGPTMDMSEVTDVKSFSDAKKPAVPKSNRTNVSSSIRPKKTPKPLPYPRISINYTVEKTRTIGSNKLDKNSTFIIVTLDIRNYGYTYFDAHQSKFRIGLKGDLRPLVNISTGKTIDAVIPNNSRAKGNLIFLLNKSVNQGKVVYHSTNTSENYNILYKKVSKSGMEEIKRDAEDDEEWK